MAGKRVILPKTVKPEVCNYFSPSDLKGYTIGTRFRPHVQVYNKRIKAWVFRVTLHLCALSFGLSAKNRALGYASCSIITRSSCVQMQCHTRTHALTITCHFTYTILFYWACDIVVLIGVAVFFSADVTFFLLFRNDGTLSRSSLPISRSLQWLLSSPTVVISKLRYRQH